MTPARPLEGPEVAEAAALFHVMGDPTRLGILVACLHEPVAVGVLAERLGLSQSLVSHHLRILRAARLVRAARRGKQVFYVAADEHVRCIVEDMVVHVGEHVLAVPGAHQAEQELADA